MLMSTSLQGVGSRPRWTASWFEREMGSRLAPEAIAPARGHEKSRGPDLAHGSEFVLAATAAG
jgi:hypothetical protein